MTIGDRIKQVREEAGLTRPVLAERAGIPYPTLAGLENGDQKDSLRLGDIAKALGVSETWLRTGKEKPLRVEDGGAKYDEWADITGYSQAAAAGDGALAEEYAETHTLKFKATSLRRKGLFPGNLSVFYASGDSMQPRIHNGDAILFDRASNQPVDGKVFVVRVDGHYYAKRLAIFGDQWFMVSDNPSDPKWKKPRPVAKASDFEVIGQVRWIGSWED